MKDTETIDRLFLELSQFTAATTAKELELQAEVKQLNNSLRASESRYAADSETWNTARLKVCKMVKDTGLVPNNGSMLEMVQSLCELLVARSNMEKALEAKAKR